MIDKVHVLYQREWDGSGFKLLRAFEDEQDATADMLMIKEAGAYGDIGVQTVAVITTRSMANDKFCGSCLGWNGAPCPRGFCLRSDAAGEGPK